METSNSVKHLDIVKKIQCVGFANIFWKTCMFSFFKQFSSITDSSFMQITHFLGKMQCMKTANFILD